MGFRLRITLYIIVLYGFLLCASLPVSAQSAGQTIASGTSVLPKPSLPASGQEPAVVHRRPTIAIVLEGGGALGFAHIGVLEWMEEHHVPIDYVAGTSMGGLVGGAYATGMRPTEVRNLVTSIDWDAVLRGSIEYSRLSLRRKQDSREYPNSLEFGLRHGVRFPAGFNSGQQVEFILDRIALPYSTAKSFDDLPIPFRCIATDLVSRSMHVFEDGSLSQALRSTMSIPGFFMPVTDQGKIYVDGGLLDNLPTDVAKDMGADTIIAVHLETAPISPDASLSSIATLAQSFSVVIGANERRGMELADILIRVDVTKFSGTDYKKADKLISQGYGAAGQSASSLLKFAVDDNAWQEYLRRREARIIKTVPVPSFIQVNGTIAQRAEAIERDLQSHQGQMINEARLEQELTVLTGTGRFTSMGYSFAEVDRRFGLHINALEKQYAPPTVNPIVLIDGSQYNNVLFSVGARLTLLDVGSPGAELRSDVLAGSTYRISSEYFRPLSDSTHWFIAPRITADSLSLNLYDRNTQLAAYRLSEVKSGLDFGYMFDRFGELRLGYETGWQKYSPKVGNPNVLPSVSGRQGFSSVRYVFDHLNDPIVPRRGVGIASEFDFFDSKPGAQEKVPALQTTMQFFKPLRRLDSIYFRASGGTTFGVAKTGVPPFTLGGPLQLSAYGTNEIFTNQFLLFQLGYLRQIGRLPPLLGNKVYFSSLYELARTYKTQTPSLKGFPELPMDVAGGILVETLFGPAYIGGSWGDSGHRKIFFKVGRLF
jgi:NTE family protein